jgi:hypothetical protein
VSAEGLLPPGRHHASLSEVRDVFVTAAPNSAHRQRLLNALVLYIDLLKDVFPSGAVWLNGGFCTIKPQPPDDVDVAVAVQATIVNALPPNKLAKLPQLLTLQNATAPSLFAGTLPRVQPMGGLVDAFIVDLSDPASMNLWDQTWSAVKDPITKSIVPGKVKGYLEVSW